jgi:hypothetical protein
MQRIRSNMQPDTRQIKPCCFQSHETTRSSLDPDRWPHHSSRQHRTHTQALLCSAERGPQASQPERRVKKCSQTPDTLNPAVFNHMKPLSWVSTLIGGPTTPHVNIGPTPGCCCALQKGAHKLVSQRGESKVHWPRGLLLLNIPCYKLVLTTKHIRVTSLVVFVFIWCLTQQNTA